MKPPEATGAFPKMVDGGIPPSRAAQKIHSTRRGWLFVGLGCFFILLGFGLVVLTMFLTKAAPSIPLLIVSAFPGLPGGYFLLAGGHQISGDAMRAAEGTGNVITRAAAKALKIARKDT